MSAYNLRLNLIIAACDNLGIGKNGTLPWSLRQEMKYFSRMTRNSSEPEKKNMVIMGRKTWESIPEKFRPLPGRVNVVISSKGLKLDHPDTYVCNSFTGALDQAKVLNQHIDKVWVIGGASVYKLAMESEHCHRIYLTRIKKEFDCDTFMPAINNHEFEKIKDPDVPEDMQQEGDVHYMYEVYQKL